jgi:hypothetical protein
MSVKSPEDNASTKAPTQIIQRLERNNKELNHLLGIMKSNTCEPKTPSLFERYEQLKALLERLHNRNIEVIQSLRGRKKCLEEQLEGYLSQISEYHELEKKVLEYIGMAKMHC